MLSKECVDFKHVMDKYPSDEEEEKDGDDGNHSFQPPVKHKSTDSEEDIFYDAYDAFILDELQKEIKRESEISDHHDSEVQNEYRTTLPAFKAEGKYSLLRILKDAIGKDITRFCVPVYFNEPVGMLQKISEMMINNDVLNKAAAEKDPLMRLVWVSGF